MATNGRNLDGTFAAGHKLATGRKGYGFESNFKQIFNEVFDERATRAACFQLKAHVFGQKLDLTTGKMVEDTDSTPQARIAAWTKFAEYKFGKPVLPVSIETEDVELSETIKQMAESLRLATDDKLEGFVDDMRKHLEKLSEQEKRKDRRKQRKPVEQAVE